VDDKVTNTSPGRDELKSPETLSDRLKRHLPWLTGATALSKLPDTIGAFIRWTVAVVAVATTVIGYIAFQLSQVGPSLRNVEIPTAVVSIMGIVVLAFLNYRQSVQGRKQSETARQQLEQLREENTKLKTASGIRAAPGVTSRAIEIRGGVATEIANHFFDLATTNSKCDYELFTTFQQIITTKSRKRLKELYAQTVQLVAENIDDTLDGARLIFDELTGSHCHVCVKIPVEVKSANYIIAIYRTKHPNRGRYDKANPEDTDPNNRPYKIDDNTAFSYIASRRGNYYVCDNLKAESEKTDPNTSQPLYKNSRREWWKDYNAALVCAITSPKSESTSNLAGFLCIDNAKGGLNNPVAIFCAMEIAARVSVMFYRSKRIEETLSGLGAS
jgi:hypothetical protein